MAGKLTTRNRNKDKFYKDGRPKPPNWEFSFEVGKVNGKRVRETQCGFKREADAIKVGTELLAKYNATGRVIPKTEMIFSEYLEKWLDLYGRKNLSESTKQSYQKRIRLYINPVLGKYKLLALTPVVLTEFLNDLADTGMAVNTLIGVKGILSNSLAYAVTNLKLLDASPMACVKLPKYVDETTATPQAPESSHKKGEKPHIYIPKDMFETIIKRFPKGESGYLPLRLGYELGTRLGESYAFTFEDIDFSNGTISINNQVQWRASSQAWFFKAPKYKSYRTIVVPAPLLEYLRELKVQTMKDRMYYGEYYTRYYLNEKNEIVTEQTDKEIHLINVRSDGTFIAPRTMQHVSQVIHYKLGFTDFDYHSLRHTHATDLLAYGCTPKYVQIRLGHKSIKVTLEIYQHLNERLEQTSADTIEKIYNNA